MCTLILRDPCVVQIHQKFQIFTSNISAKKTANEYNCSHLIDLENPIAYVPSKNNCDTSSSVSSDDAKGLEKVLCLSMVPSSCYVQFLSHIMDSSIVPWVLL